MMNRIIMSVGMVLLASGVQSAQVKVVNNYDDLTVTASIKEPNNIMLEGDRISQMKAPGNTLIDACNGKPNCKLIDEATGVLTFLPSPLYQTRAFTINLFTEKGNVYNVRVEPKPIASQMIVLKAYQKPVIRAREPKTSGYEKSIMNFLTYLANDQIPEGFTQIIPSKAEVYKAKRTAIRRLLTVKGNQLCGEVFELTNLTNQPVDVKESWFNWPGTKGVAIAKHHLAPHEKTRFYRIS